MKEVDEPLSNNALASTEDPSGAMTSTRQVMRRALDLSLTAAFEVTWGGGWGTVGTVEGELLETTYPCGSTCKSV